MKKYFTPLVALGALFSGPDLMAATDCPEGVNITYEIFSNLGKGQTAEINGKKFEKDADNFTGMSQFRVLSKKDFMPKLVFEEKTEDGRTKCVYAYNVKLSSKERQFTIFGVN